MIAFRWAM